MRILFYATSSGRRPVEEFIQAQGERLRAAISWDLDKLRAYGMKAPGVSLRHIAGLLWEIRVSAGGAARIFYCSIPGDAEETLVLLHAYQKKTQKVPPREIKTAKRRMREVLP